MSSIQLEDLNPSVPTLIQEKPAVDALNLQIQQAERDLSAAVGAKSKTITRIPLEINESEQVLNDTKEQMNERLIAIKEIPSEIKKWNSRMKELQNKEKANELTNKLLKMFKDALEYVNLVQNDLELSEDNIWDYIQQVKEKVRDIDMICKPVSVKLQPLGLLANKILLMQPALGFALYPVVLNHLQVTRSMNVSEQGRIQIQIKVTRMNHNLIEKLDFCERVVGAAYILAQKFVKEVIIPLINYSFPADIQKENEKDKSTLKDNKKIDSIGDSNHFPPPIHLTFQNDEKQNQIELNQEIIESTRNPIYSQKQITKTIIIETDTTVSNSSLGLNDYLIRHREEMSAIFTAASVTAFNEKAVEKISERLKNINIDINKKIQHYILFSCMRNLEDDVDKRGYLQFGYPVMNEYEEIDENEIKYRKERKRIEIEKIRLNKQGQDNEQADNEEDQEEYEDTIYINEDQDQQQSSPSQTKSAPNSRNSSPSIHSQKLSQKHSTPPPISFSSLSNQQNIIPAHATLTPPQTHNTSPSAKQQITPQIPQLLSDNSKKIELCIVERQLPEIIRDLRSILESAAYYTNGAKQMFQCINTVLRNILLPFTTNVPRLKIELKQAKDDKLEKQFMVQGNTLLTIAAFLQQITDLNIIPLFNADERIKQFERTALQFLNPIRIMAEIRTNELVGVALRKIDNMKQTQDKKQQNADKGKVLVKYAELQKCLDEMIMQKMKWNFKIFPSFLPELTLSISSAFYAVVFRWILTKPSLTDSMVREIEILINFATDEQMLNQDTKDRCIAFQQMRELIIINSSPSLEDIIEMIDDERVDHMDQQQITLLIKMIYDDDDERESSLNDIRYLFKEREKEQVDDEKKKLRKEKKRKEKERERESQREKEKQKLKSDRDMKYDQSIVYNKDMGNITASQDKMNFNNPSPQSYRNDQRRYTLDNQLILPQPLTHSMVQIDSKQPHLSLSPPYISPQMHTSTSEDIQQPHRHITHGRTNSGIQPLKITSYSKVFDNLPFSSQQQYKTQVIPKQTPAQQNININTSFTAPFTSNQQNNILSTAQQQQFRLYPEETSKYDFQKNEDQQVDIQVGRSIPQQMSTSMVQVNMRQAMDTENFYPAQLSQTVVPGDQIKLSKEKFSIPTNTSSMTNSNTTRIEGANTLREVKSEQKIENVNKKVDQGGTFKKLFSRGQQKK
ncbi:MAG: hypothetical protein EZS28_014875 [Streblomastix strix]|uniref:Uncharacterized protein n=1 Tax=Streblomastix strix TaxID=222440 RepID=A0A5J4W583_9EUKA|nr:MAG: hypothetical protein EZS28_014875 [Streblomastix strix]